jgi:hypothetical protein
VRYIRVIGVEAVANARVADIKGIDHSDTIYRSPREHR